MMLPSRPLIYACCRSGLGNRLSALLGYRALSLCLNVPFLFYWQRDVACDARYPELFCKPRHFERIKKRIEFEEMARAATVVREARSPYRIWLLHGREFATWPQFRLLLLRARAELLVNPPILQIADQFAAAHGLADATGIHIRQTDNVAEYKKWAGSSSGFDPRCVSQVSGFFREIDARLAGGAVYVATDSPAMERRVTARFGDAVIVYEKKYKRGVWLTEILRTFGLIHRRTRTTTVTVAFIELLLLGRCREIVGTYYSSFGQMAAFLGNTSFCEMHGDKCVPVVDPVGPVGLVPVTAKQGLGEG
jgi:hypothetical protein